MEERGNKQKESTRERGDIALLRGNRKREEMLMEAGMFYY